MRTGHALAATLALLTMATPALAASLGDFGHCLSRKGAVFYGASWCGYCRLQKQTLGDAMSGVRYVECSADGSREVTSSCKAAGVESYPTWVFGDGTRASGVQTLGELAEKTGCVLPSSKGGSQAAAPASGPKIINVPQ